MSPLAMGLRGLVILYRLLVSPYLPPSCRFYPSCSAYALEALAEHGAILGVVYTLKRLAKCQPWGGAGFDPVRKRSSSSQALPTKEKI
ncbi:MAG: membrane protein insertion efficiency factor YidD [Pseudomonadota bacterium]|nr:membrane protein insertion efficiency factor YidD [Pseudomonadota bacterium]